MTVGVTTRRNDVQGDGSTDTFSFSWRITDESDLLVVQEDDEGTVTELVLDTDYTVAGVGLFAGGTITLTAGVLASGFSLSILDAPASTQGLSLRNRGGFFPEDHEDAFDRLTRISRYHEDQLARTVRFPETDGVSLNNVLPAASVRASKFQAFDADGNVMASEGSGTPASAFMATVLDDLTAAAAKATLGAASLTGGNTFEGAQVFNEAGADVDLRVEGDTDANLLFVDAGNDRIGIGTATPGAKLDVQGSLNVQGAAVFNEDGADVDFRIEGDTKANLFFVDASTDRIGIGTNAPAKRLHAVGDVRLDGYVDIVVNLNEPVHFQITNTNAGIANLCEFRANNGTAAGDFGVAGTGYDDGSNLEPNEVFVVAESTAAGLHFKNNGGNYTRFSIEVSGVIQEVARFAATGALLIGHGTDTSTARGNISLNNAAALMARNNAETDNLSLISLSAIDRTQIHCNSKILNFTDSLTQATAGAVSTYLRVEVGGNDLVIPCHAES